MKSAPAENNTDSIAISANDSQRTALRERRLFRTVVAAVLVLTILRLVFSAVAELLPEEAYYWTYWKHPAWSYFDHPPMVAWVIGIGTAVFGDCEFGVRFGTILLSLASCALVLATSTLWFGRRTALWSALLYALLPIFAIAGFVVTPDQPLLFFWLLALFGFSKALRSGRWIWWLLGGVAFGGALLSKYYALLLGPSLLLFLLISREHRRWLLRAQPWAAFAVALAVFSPVIFWNAENNWASFLFQSTRTVNPHPHRLRYFFRFWAVQTGIVTPLVFALFGVAVWHGTKRLLQRRDENDRWNFVLSFSLPLFLLFVVSSLKTEVHVNWTAPAFLALLPGAVWVFLNAVETSAVPSRARWWRIGAWVSLGFCVATVVISMTSLAWGVPRIYAQAGGWRRIAAAVEATEQALEKKSGRDPFVLDTGKYDLAAEVGFYSREPEEQVNNYALGKRGLGFRYWTDLENFKGAPAVALLEEPDHVILRELRERFDEIGEPTMLTATGPGWHERKIYVVECHGYRGATEPETHRK